MQETNILLQPLGLQSAGRARFGRLAVSDNPSRCLQLVLSTAATDKGLVASLPREV
jgi:hypothetical protein